MYARLAILALALAVCHAFPQHGGSFSSFGSASYGHNAGYGGGYGFARNYGGGYGGQGYVAAVAPVAKVVAPVAVAKVVAPVVVGKQVAHVDHFAPPHYQFEYAVRDEHTGDAKSHHEQREGDSTKGYYTVHEPDGTLLTVHYTVDKDSGFQAVVERTGHATHPQAVKKVAVVAPVIQHAPVVHHAPLLQAAKYY